MTTTPPENPPFRADSGDSPSGADVPIWVTACVRLCSPAGGAADKAITAAQILLADRIRVYGQDRAVTTHADLATFLDYSRRDKVRWVIDFLQQIGFLSVPERHGAEVDKHGRRKPRREENTRRTASDTFLVHERPPAGYVGPRTLHELRDALRERRQWTADELFLDPTTEAGSDAAGSCTSEQVQDPAALYPKSGTGDISAGQACTSEQVQDPAALYPKSGTGDISAGQACTSNEDVPFKEGSFASFRRKEGSEASLRERDAAPLREADGVAREYPEVWALAEAAPWAAKGHDIRASELVQLVPAIVQTMQTRGLALDQAQQHLDQAVAKLTSRSAQKRIEFVTNAFTKYAPAVAHPNQRPLPDLTEPSSAETTQGAGAANSDQRLAAVESTERASAWCGECKPMRGADGKPACRSTCEHPATAA